MLLKSITVLVRKSINNDVVAYFFLFFFFFFFFVRKEAFDNFSYGKFYDPVLVLLFFVSLLCSRPSRKRSKLNKQCTHLIINKIKYANV